MYGNCGLIIMLLSFTYNYKAVELKTSFVSKELKLRGPIIDIEQKGSEVEN